MLKRIEEINGEINRLKAEMENVKGTQTEVYSRIVGYYRSVKNWNKGKREEFGHRVLFRNLSPREGIPGDRLSGTEEFTIYYFFRKHCPNCPPVTAYLAGRGCEYGTIDVDTEEGLAFSREHNVLSTPTVLALYQNGGEAFRSSNLKAITAFFEGSVLKAEYVS